MIPSFQGVILFCAFLIGSIPFGLIIARVFHVQDLTSQGSGNIGATNVSRVIGFWPAGFLTFALDVLKGILPIALLAFTGLPELLAALLPVQVDAASLVTPLLIWSTGLFTVLGHCYSPWLHFRGGKGVATGFGVMLVLSPLSALVGLLAFAYTFFRTRTGSLSSLGGIAMASAAYLVMNPVGAQLGAGALMIFVILMRHESNLDALLENRENTFG